MSVEAKARRSDLAGWISTGTEFHAIKLRLLGEPSEGLSAWSRTTSGIIVMLLFLQVTTGILLGFHYVPSVDTAYQTTAYVELAVREGAWIRSLHYHSSVLLPMALVLHLLQMLVRKVWRTDRTAWNFAVVMLGLVLAAGATGYALPWDARAINGVNIAASLAGNAPLIGPTFKSWIINGTAITTLTLSRFYALHVWIVPIFIFASVAARLFIFGKPASTDPESGSIWAREQFARNMIVVGLVFVGLSLYSQIYPAPLGPQSADAATYLPRPGPQFLWLFEMQKYTDGTVAALLAAGFPSLIMGGLIALPFVIKKEPKIIFICLSAIFAIGFSSVAVLTAIAVYQDLSDTRISAQLEKQRSDEADFRASAFQPQIMKVERLKNIGGHTPSLGTEIALQGTTSAVAMPDVYPVNCAKCHGAAGEGTAKFPELTGLLTRDEDRLDEETILAIINDPEVMGRGNKMPAYKDKLSDEQKSSLVAWIRSLSPAAENKEFRGVQTAKVSNNEN